MRGIIPYFVDYGIAPDPAQLFTEAYKKHLQELCRHCQWQLSNGELAEEIAQETFLRTWEYMQSGKQVENIRTFLFRVANNLIIDERRRQSRGGQKVSLEVLQQSGFDPSHDTLEQAQMTLDAQSMITTLNPGRVDLKLLRLRYVDGLRIADVAKQSGMTVHAVAMRLHRLLKRLNAQVKSKQSVY